jgi:hypothetical protein
MSRKHFVSMQTRLLILSLLAVFFVCCEAKCKSFYTDDPWAIRWYNKGNCKQPVDEDGGTKSTSCRPIGGKGAKSFYMIGRESCWLEAWDVPDCKEGVPPRYAVATWSPKLGKKPKFFNMQRVWRLSAPKLGKNQRLMSYKATCYA